MKKDTRDFMFIGSKIAALRHERGISAATLSELINKSPGYITKLENGACIPTLYTLRDICEYFQIELKDLMDRDNRFPPLQRELMRLTEHSSKRKIKTMIYLAQHLDDSVDLAEQSAGFLSNEE